jgi:hypothetical protein
VSTEEQALARGMRIVAGELSDVTADRAAGDVRAVYADIRHRLRVPVVNFVFRAAANEPRWLRCAWEGVARAVSTPAFERAADALRAEGTAPADLDPAVASEAGEEARAYVATIHYVLPKLLLVTSAWSAALDRGPGDRREPRPLEGALPQGVADGARDVAMVDHRQAGSVGETLREIAARHGHPAPATFYRGLANWPQLLAATWARVGPLVGTPGHRSAREQAIAGAARRAGELDLPARVRCPAPRDGWHDVLQVFRLRLIPDLMFTTGIVRGLIGGPQAASTSPFSAVSPSGA